MNHETPRAGDCGAHPSFNPSYQVTMIKAAEAEAESKFLQGQGMARQRQASGRD